MFVLLKLTWYDSILLKLRREKLKKSILRAGKKVFSIWRLRHRICDCVSFLESFQLSFHGFSHHFCMNSSLKNLMQTQVTRLARFISTKLATANRLRVSIGCRPCKNFHLIWFIIYNLVAVSHTVCANVVGPEILRRRWGPAPMGRGVVDVIEIRYSPTCTKFRRSRSNRFGVHRGQKTLNRISPWAWVTPNSGSKSGYLPPVGI